MQKLDVFSKILLATGQINMVSCSLNEVIKGYKILKGNRESKFCDDAISDHNKALNECLTTIVSALQKLNDYMNDGDMVCEIDARMSNAANEILFFDMDEITTDYSLKNSLNTENA